jgi:probable HAF family extracellular repeat protein
LCAALLALAPQVFTAARAAEYTARELVVLPPAASQIVGALNNRGQVAGAVSAAGAIHHRAFVATDVRIEAIEMRAGSNYAAARDINDDGEVVGSANKDDTVAAFHWTARGGMQLLPALPGDSTSEAFRISRDGQIVGYSSGAGGIRAVLWSRDGAVHELPGVPKGKYSRALAINSRGDVAGSVGRAPETRAVLWTAAGAKYLGALPGDRESEAAAINEAGQVVGWSRGAAGIRAVLWSSGEIVDLGALNGAQHTKARAINGQGQVVGDSGGAHRSRAFVWTRARGMHDLNALIPAASGIVLVEAVAINEQGQIIALGHDYDPARQAQHGHHGDHADNPLGRAAPVRVFRLDPAR